MSLIITRGFGPVPELQIISAVDLDVQLNEDFVFTIDIDGDGGNVSQIKIKQGEARTLAFTITRNSASLSLEGTTLEFVVKENKNDTDYIIQKVNADFGIIQADEGIVTLSLTAEDTQITPDVYVAELRIALVDDSIVKTEDIDFIIERSVFNVE
ncbi:MAG: BppU family phage baseplate upper protein [Desulfobacterales bacterium]|nr:BppU family phage baseplate upper protein [Desulfobacterales bacterium]